ncbi:MAG: YhcH/YjgK/YiaL family protein [Kiritimatiellia bacterium]|jgi:YhcH/YjgK/YiaL family protein
MIVDLIKNAALYKGLDGGIRTALEYLAKTDFATMTPGRHDLEGNSVYALVQQYITKPMEQGLWEAHRRYIDVQYVAKGIESMGYAPIGNLKETRAYAPKNDYALFAGTGDFVTARAGTFAIFFPEDAHMPCIAGGTPAPVRKVVVKVAVK